MEGIDYAWARPDLAQAAADGKRFICRYLSYDVSKNLDAGELAQAFACGMTAVLVWETTAGRALQGYNPGHEDALEAHNQAIALNLLNGPLHFAVDFDAADSDREAIEDYFRGVNSAIGLARTWAYGGVKVIGWLFDSGLIAGGWQTYAWSWDYENKVTIWDPRAQLQQYENGVDAYGGNIDLNRSLKDDFGQYPRPQSQPASEDEDMEVTMELIRGAPDDGIERWQAFLDSDGYREWAIFGMSRDATEPLTGQVIAKNRDGSVAWYQGFTLTHDLPYQEIEVPAGHEGRLQVDYHKAGRGDVPTRRSVKK